jgi:hypothetical protein
MARGTVSAAWSEGSPMQEALVVDDRKCRALPQNTRHAHRVVKSEQQLSESVV